MKKTASFILVLIISLIMLADCPAHAVSSEQLPYFVSDSAGVLTSDQWQKLEERAERISNQYNCGVYIVTLGDYQDFGSYKSFWDFSQDFYSQHCLSIRNAH